MKKIALAFLSLIIAAPAFGAAKTYADTEQKYIFTAENLAATIPDFIQDETKQTAMAQKYTALMNQETGAVSIADLFAICRAGGLNTYRADGFGKCRDFVTALLNNTDNEIDESALGGFCPGLDENGKNPNKLASITDKTRVGDMCTSSHIAMGEVVFQRNDSYSCTCMALVCNGNYDLRGGACNTPIPVGTPICPNTKHPETPENNTTAKCVEFCNAKASRDGCALSGIVMRHSTKECICSANADEIAAAKASMQRAAQNVACPTSSHPETAANNTMDKCIAFCQSQAQTNNCKFVRSLMMHSTKQCVCNPDSDKLANSSVFRAVCGADKGKTGKKEYCIDNVFNWTDVQLLQGVGLAEEWVQVKHKRKVTCRTKYRKGSKTSFSEVNDDFVQCVTPDGSVYYEFKFDDLIEMVDKDIQLDVRKALCEGIYGGKLNSGYDCMNISEATCTGALAQSAKKFSYDVAYRNKSCKLSLMGRSSDDSTIAEIDGIDSYVFYHQMRAIAGLESKLRDYVKTVKNGVNSFSCVKNPRQMSKIKGHSVDGLTDDVVRCVINGNQEVDFVFKDLSETSATLHRGAMQNIDCKVLGGEYNGSECMYLGEAACKKLMEVNATTCPTCKKIQWDGEFCLMPSAEDAKDLQNNEQLLVIAAGAVAGVVLTVATGGTGGVALALLVVETAGSAVEFEATRRIQNAGDDFLAESKRCKDASCAERMLRDNLQRMADFANDLDYTVVNGIDAELERLALLLPPDSNFYKELMKQGTSTGANDKGLSSWQPEEIWRAVGVTLQLASILHSIISWGVNKLPRATAALRNAGRASDAAIDVARGTAHVDDAVRGAAHTDDVVRVVESSDNVSDALRQARQMTVDEELERIGVRYVGNGNYHDLRNGNKFISHENVLKRIDELPYETERAAARRAANAAEGGATSGGRAASNAARTESATSGGTSAARVTSQADDAGDAVRTGNVASDAARTERATSGGTSAARVTSQADDAGDAVRAGNVASDAARTERATSGGTSAAREAVFEQKLEALGYDDMVREYKRTGVRPSFPAESLTADEWAQLARRAEAEGIELVHQDGALGGSYTFGRDVSSGATSGGHATSGGRAASNAARTESATSGASHTGNVASDAARTEREAANARVRANTPTESQLDEMIAKGRQNKAAREAAEAVDNAEFTVWGRKAVSVTDNEDAIAQFVSPNNKLALDDEIFDLREAYWREADRAVDEAGEIAAWDKYHQNMLDYLGTKFDPNKTRAVALERRNMYLNAIASDDDLSNMAMRWSSLKDSERQQFMQKVVDRVDNGYCRGDNCTVGIAKSGNWNDNSVSKINIDFDQKVAYRSDGTVVPINPRENLSDAMLALAHEHAHNITRFAPESSSLPEEYIGLSLAHAETGRPEQEFKRALNIPDYLRGIVEKEGFWIGEIVGKDFAEDLHRILGR